MIIRNNKAIKVLIYQQTKINKMRKMRKMKKMKKRKKENKNFKKTIQKNYKKIKENPFVKEYWE